MRLTEDGSRLVVADTPGGLWLFGLVFVASGSFVLLSPWLVDNWSTLGGWERLAVFGIGLGHLAGGVWTVVRHSATRTELDRAGGVGTHEVRRPFARQATVTRFALSDVRTVEIVRSKDSDGDPMFQLRLWLTGSRSLWLQANPTHGESRAGERAEQIRGFLELGERERRALTG